MSNLLFVVFILIYAFVTGVIRLIKLAISNAILAISIMIYTAYWLVTTGLSKQKHWLAGGDTVGMLRSSLSWYNYDDLDIAAIEPNGERIYFHNKVSDSGGKLDIDMNAGAGTTRKAVENIIWKHPSNLQYSSANKPYVIEVHNFCKRETSDVGFVVQIEYDGVMYEFTYDRAVAHREKITVAKFFIDKVKGIQFIESLPRTSAVKQVWGIETNTWNKVNLVMLSPNYWDGNETGNKHWFFMLDNCKNPDSARGFYNEFLRTELVPHRKTFEMLGSKLKAKYNDNQLSGVGFSSTVQNSVLCRVTGTFNRVIKINF
jgi:hypothetical protein